MPRALSSILGRQKSTINAQSNAEIEGIVVLYVGSGLLVPRMGGAFVAVRLVGVGRLAREALPPCIDAVADQAGALADALSVIDGFLVVHAAAPHAQHRPTAVEAHVQRDAPVLAGVGEGAVQRLAVG